MKVIKYRLFEKSFKKVPAEIKVKFNEQIKIFYDNINDMRLDNHALHGKWTGHRSIKLTSDWRIIFKEVSQDVFVLVNIGTHSQLYG